MRYPEDRYRRTNWDTYLELHAFDGTCRGVCFSHEDHAQRALLPGRAELDRALIEDGMLPAGATLVSRAGPSAETEKLMVPDDLDGRPSDPFALVRMRFSVSIAASRTDYVTPERDVVARRRLPARAAAYSAAVEAIDKRREGR